MKNIITLYTTGHHTCPQRTGYQETICLKGSPQSRSEDMENGKCIQDRVEHCFQRQNYVHLVSKICTKHIHACSFFHLKCLNICTPIFRTDIKAH